MAFTSTNGPRCEIMKQLYEANKSRRGKQKPEEILLFIARSVFNVSNATLGIKYQTFW